jgi:PAS domain-containing protein
MDGTPCIYVSGDIDKLGIITNCNAGASRVFGYSLLEIKHNNVEKLMPEMYGKYHYKMLDDAL